MLIGTVGRIVPKARKSGPNSRLHILQMQPWDLCEDGHGGWSEISELVLAVRRVKETRRSSGNAIARMGSWIY